MKSKDIKIGQSLKVIRNDWSSYGLTTGMIVKCTAKSGSSVLTDGCAHYVEAAVFAPATTDKVSIDKELVAAQAAVDAVKAKLAYLEESGSEHFDEQEFKCFEA